MRYNLNFSTSHHQIYLCDKDSLRETDAFDFWTEEAAKSRLAINSTILGIGLECYGDFKGELILLEAKNDTKDFSSYDHVVEAGVDIESGVLQVLDCPGSNVEFELELVPGTYGVRVYSLNLKSVLGDSGEDYYIIELWPDRSRERIVIKQFVDA
ncbi:MULTISPECIES: hypothetical protein [unclassified Paraflavitalea]|uniref:hypothetical protein n=1 Tax=unclassified Paraflavitalea TaxID=2798305 RepID=UPI003D335F6D